MDPSLGLMRAIDQLRCEITRVDARLSMMQIECGMLAMHLQSLIPNQAQNPVLVSAQECERIAQLMIMRARMATDACTLSNMRADHNILMELVDDDRGEQKMTD